MEHYYTRKPKSKPRYGIIHTVLRGLSFKFYTASGVFSKTRIDAGTRLLVETMIIPPQGMVLDLGCGYGPVGIVAAALNPGVHVVMVDTNRRAVGLAKKNAKANNVSNVTVKRGDLYEPVETKFQAILTNPPQSAGIKTITLAIQNATQYLTPKGTFQTVVRSRIGGKQIATLMEQIFNNVEVLSRKGGYRVLLSKKQKYDSTQFK